MRETHKYFFVTNIHKDTNEMNYNEKIEKSQESEEIKNAYEKLTSIFLQRTFTAQKV